MGLNMVQQRLDQDAKEIKSDLIRNQFVSRNVSAIKRLENLMQQRKDNLTVSDRASHPIFYPNNYTDPDVYISDTSALTDSMPWKYRSSGRDIVIPVASQSALNASNLYSQDTVPSLNTKNPVIIESMEAVYSDTDPFLITHFQVEATSTYTSRNGNRKTFKTKALVEVPPPPPTNCELGIPGKLYPPSSTIDARLTVRGIATHYEAPGADRRRITPMNRPFDSKRYNIKITTPRPLPVLDGKKEMNVTVTAKVMGIQGNESTCSATYRLALTPNCGISPERSPLRPGECTNIRTLTIGADDNDNVRLSTNSGSLTGNQFCMAADAAHKSQHTIFGSVPGGASGIDGQCQTQIMAITSGSPGTPTTPGNPGNPGNPGTPGNPGNPGGSISFTELCPMANPLQKGPGMILPTGTWKDKGQKVFQVAAISRSPTNTMLCPDNARCYAQYKKAKSDDTNYQRNRFYIINNFTEKDCQPNLVDRIQLGCFHGGTSIRMADGELKPASAIVKGDLLWNPVTKKAVEVSRTSTGPEHLPLVKIITKDRELTVTTEHPILTKTGLIAADLLTTDHFIMNSAGSWQPITSIGSHVPKDTTIVYNFEISNHSKNPADHYVEADGIVSGDLYLQERLHHELESHRQQFSLLHGVK